MKRLFLILCSLVLTSTAFAQYTWDAPSSVATNQSYTVSVSFDWSGDYVNLYKNGSWVAGGWGGASYTSSDGSAGTATFYVETEYWESGTVTDVRYVSVVESNVPPVPSVVVDGLSHGGIVTRPNGGSVSVTVRFRATDGNGNLSGIRPQIWKPDVLFDNNGGAFVGQSGGFGEVVRTVTLNSNGDWYFWTDAQDATIAPGHIDSGAWGSGFRLTVNEAPPANQAPSVQSVTADQTFLYAGQSTVIRVRATDGNGSLRYVRLDRIDGSGNTYGAWFGAGDSFNADSPPSNGSYDIGGNSSDYTRNITMTFPSPGVFRFRGYAQDIEGASNSNSAGADLYVTVGRNPTGTIQILDASHNPLAPDGSGRVKVPLGQQFYVRVNGSDGDGNLSSLWVRLNKPDGSGSMWETVGTSGGSAYYDFGPRTADTLGVWDVWGHVVDTTNTGYQWEGGGWYGIGGPDVEVYQANRPPSSVSINSPPASIKLGDPVQITSTAVDPDGNLTNHMLWRRGPRTSDTFAQDWNDWQNYWDNSANWSNWSNPGVAAGGATSPISATYTPPAAGFWQFHANAWDAAGLWGPGGTTGAVFVAPLPSASISATSTSGGAASGGGSIVAYVTDTLTVTSGATASGWLSEHNVFSYAGTSTAGQLYYIPGGGHLTPSSSVTSNVRTGSWTPPSHGTFTIYAEAFTGLAGGDRVNGTSGYPGSFDAGTNKRLTVQVRRNPTATIDILDGAQNLVAPNGSNQAPLTVGSNFYIRVNGSSPDGSVGRLYVRFTPPGGATVGYDVAASGATASYVFGPFAMTAAGVWDVWAHAVDADAPGWGSVPNWDGTKFGWSSAVFPDIVGNSAPAPTIVSQPQSISTVRGQDVQFNVVASGVGPISYQWYKDDIAIVGATGSTLNVAVTADSGGAYKVLVSNSSGGTFSTAATLTVNVEPWVTWSGTTQVDNGTTIELALSPTDDHTPSEALTVTVQAFNTTLFPAANISLSGSGANRMLRLIPAGENSGLSFVRITVNDGTLSSSRQLSVKVRAKSSPVTLTVDLSQMTTSQSATITAAGGEYSSGNFEFYTNGGLLNGVGAQRAFSSSDAGTFTISARRLGDVSYSTTPWTTIAIVVTPAGAAPVISVQPSPVSVTVGQQAKFTVVASGDPEPGYQWRKNGTNIPGEVSNSLTISNVTFDNAGTYSVVVTNSAGTATSNGAVLTVNGPNQNPTVEITEPAVTEPEIIATVVYPGTIAIAASATDADGTVVKVEFFANGQKFAEDTSAPYSVSWTVPGPGEYLLRARATDNQGGIGESAEVGVQSYPSLPYVTDFESGEGYTAGSLNAQKGWAVQSGTVSVTNTQTPALGQQSVRFEAGGTAAAANQVFASAGTPAQPVFADLMIKPFGGTDQNTGSKVVVDGNSSVVVKNGQYADLWSFDGNGTGGGVWRTYKAYVPMDSGGSAIKWHRVTFRLNYATRTYDVFVDGRLVAFDIHFTNDLPAYFESLEVRGVTGAATGLDDVFIAAENPLYTDANGNGIDDAWEDANRIPTASRGRYADPDGDGRSNIQEWRDGTHPLYFNLEPAPDLPRNLDSDGDGMPDYWELQHGLNPFNPADGASTADLDNDGMSNLAEFQAGRNPASNIDAKPLPEGYQLVIKTPTGAYLGVRTSTWELGTVNP